MARTFLGGGLLTAGSRPDRSVAGMAAPEILWASAHDGGDGNGGADAEAINYMLWIRYRRDAKSRSPLPNVVYPLTLRYPMPIIREDARPCFPSPNAV